MTLSVTDKPLKNFAGQNHAAVNGPPAITHTRPAWMDEGLVIAGNWSSIPHRKENIVAPWNQRGHKLTDEQAAAGYLKEMTPEMADKLKEYGVNMVVMFMFSGLGTLEDERPGMEDVKRFSALLHERGIKLGVYIHCASFTWRFLQAKPEAYDWLVWPDFDDDRRRETPEVLQKKLVADGTDPTRSAVRYQCYRHHPGYLNMMFELVDYAINEMKVDLLHFDNWINSAGWSPWAVEDFRGYLRLKYSPEKLKELFGDDELTNVARDAKEGKTTAAQEWKYFEGWILAESYRKLCDYARSLRADIAIDANTSGFNVTYCGHVDMSLILPHGDSFWHEQSEQGWKPERRILNTSIRTYKFARLFHQAKYCYTFTRLANCEALAFNYDCQGCLYWFMYGRLTGPAWEPYAYMDATKELLPETNFYLKHRDIFVGGETLADVAVLRGRATNIVGPVEAAENVYLFEQAMIACHVPFDIIFDQHLEDLSRWACVALPDARLLADEQIDLLINYVEQGGTLLLTGQPGAADQWNRPRKNGGPERFLKNPAAAFGGELVEEKRGKGRILYLRIERPEAFEPGSIPLNASELAQAATRGVVGVCVMTSAPEHVCMEFVRHPGRLAVQMLDYSEDPKLGSFEIGIASSLGKVNRARLLSPWAAEMNLKIQSHGNYNRVTVPGLNVYGVIVFESGE